MVQGLFGQILQKLAQGFRTVQSLTADELLYFCENLAVFCHRKPVTFLSQESIKACIALQVLDLYAVTVFNGFKLPTALHC